MKIEEAIGHISISLENIYDQREAKNIAYLLIGHVLGVTKARILASAKLELGKSEEETILSFLEELKTNKPIQYVVESTRFYDCDIRVNGSVLIPRPETEELVSLLISENKHRSEPFRILDIGTGSGCIAIAVKKHMPNAEVSACDISGPALDIANENAKLNNTEINFHCFDMLDKCTWPVLKPFDIIVSNPPYVRESEKKLMHKNVLDFEPAMALFVPDEDPLKFYRSVAIFAKEYLSREGCLYLEINETLGLQTSQLFIGSNSSEIKIIYDFHGRERFIRIKTTE